MTRPQILVTLVTVAFAWNAALVAAVPAAAGGASVAPAFSAAMYAAGALICHQRPERSFHWAGAQLPVCARCLGLYAGAALGALAWVCASGVRRRPAPRAGSWSRRLRPALVATALPTLATVAIAWTGLWEPGNFTRALLALPLGAAAAALVAAFAAGDLE